MSRFKEHYLRYALIVLILGLGVVISLELTSFLGGLLGAATIYVLLRGQMNYMTEQRKWRPSVVASLLLIEAILFFLVPIILVVWMIINQVQGFTLQPEAIMDQIQNIDALIYDKTSYHLLKQENIAAIIGVLPKMGQWLLMRITGFVINIAVLLLVLYFMLIGGRTMERYCRELLPFNVAEATRFVHEVRMIVRSNAIGIPLLALVQGIVAYVGYLIFGVSNPFFWSVMTCFATIIPVVGTGLIWFPLAVYFALTGEWFSAIGLALYGGIILSNADNALRFVLQKKMADTHPLITVFGVIIGLSLFGFMGVIFGPLLLAIFIFCVDIFKRKYIDEIPDDRLFCNDCPPAPRKNPVAALKRRKNSDKL
jgi:predicted PurR-regulated permease PerM